MIPIFLKIDIFLVTSKNEGGPITALEAVASGRMIMGYDIGAIKERFKAFPYIVNSNFSELCNSALDFLKLEVDQKNSFVSDIREYYILNLSNKNKGSKLLELFK